METQAQSLAAALEARIAALRGELQAQPEQPLRWAELGDLLSRAGQPADALEAANAALHRQPGLAAALDVRARAHLAQGRAAQAEADFRAVLTPQTVAPQIRLNLAQAVLQQGRHEEALQMIRQVVTRNPQMPEAHAALSLAQEDRGQVDAALASVETALRLRPTDAQLHFRRATVLVRQMRMPEAQAAYREGLRLMPDAARMHSSLLYSMMYVDAPAAAVAAEHREWARRHTAHIPRITQYANSRDPERTLRVAQVAPTFKAHAGGIVARGWIEHFDPKAVEITLYSDVTAPDHLTAHYKARANRWRDVAGWSDERLAAQIQADGIDILIDRSGHAADHRLLLFARRPAPIQVNYLEYMNTTGLDAIDYWLSDPLLTPLSLQPQYAERIWHLERCLAHYSPPPECPTVPLLPAQANGHVTFSVFNNPLKITPRCLSTYARILHALPTARLVFKYGAWSQAEVCDRMRQRLAAEGIGPERFSFAGASTRQAYLAAFGATDIALDTFPTAGLVTTLEALWMGVPVVTLCGETTAARIGLSLLTALGHPEWVASTEQQYVDLAVALASDVPKLAALRASLREQMARSPLRDGPGHARSIESALRGIWRQWCKGDGG